MSDVGRDPNGTSGGRGLGIGFGDVTTGLDPNVGGAETIFGFGPRGPDGAPSNVLPQGPSVPTITGDPNLGDGGGGGGCQVTERFQQAGSWSVALKHDTPTSVLLALIEFGTVVVTPGYLGERPDLDIGDAGVLAAARYSGIVIEKPDEFTLTGAGLAWALGGSTHGGNVVQAPVRYLGNLSTVLTALLPSGSAITPGTVTTAGLTSVDIVLQWMSQLSAVMHLCVLAGAEWRVRPDGTIDAALSATLFPTGTTPTVVLSEKAAGPESPTLRGLQATVLTPGLDAKPWASGVVAVAKTGDGAIAPVGTASAPSNPYKDIHGNALTLERLVDASSTDAASIATVAQATQNLATVRKTVTLACRVFDIGLLVKPGDSVWAYDAVAGLVDSTQQIDYRGETISPAKLRVQGLTWPIEQGMGVYYRDKNGAYTDLTPFCDFSTNADTQIDVGVSADTSTDTSAVQAADTSALVTRTNNYPLKTYATRVYDGGGSATIGGAGLVQVCTYHIVNSAVLITEAQFTFGAGMAAGTGIYYLALPVMATAAAAARGGLLGAAYVYDGGGNVCVCVARLAIIGPTSFAYFQYTAIPPATGLGQVGAAAPYAAAAGWTVWGGGWSYEAA